MELTRGLDNPKRATFDTNTNYNKPFETQLESAIFDSSSRFSPEIAGSLNWNPREEYANATGFSFSTGAVGITTPNVVMEQPNGCSALPFEGDYIPDNLTDAPHVFQDQGNGWSALPFQGGYIPDRLSVDDMPPLMNRRHDVEDYEVDLPCSPSSTLNQYNTPSSVSHTGSFGTPSMSKSKGDKEKKPQNNRCARRKAEQDYRGRKRHSAREVKNFLERRGFPVEREAAWANALTLLDICKYLEIRVSRCRCA